MKKSCGCLSLVVLAGIGFSVWCFIMGAHSPLQKYYDQVDSMTQPELDQEYAKLIHTLNPHERRELADRMQFYRGEGRVAEEERRELKYHAGMSGMSSAWNQLHETVKAFRNLPSVSPSPSDSDIAASPTPTPHHKPHHRQ